MAGMLLLITITFLPFDWGGGVERDHQDQESAGFAEDLIPELLDEESPELSLRHVLTFSLMLRLVRLPLRLAQHNRAVPD